MFRKILNQDMFSNKPTINILTSLLLSKGVRKAVLCPGSRNIPIVHNFLECDDMECFQVTDERSAAFYALGLSLATGEPVVVCVTSGSALLNTSPAVVEAFYRHIPLIVISADRPQEWIGRLDGQTMVQTNSLSNYVKSQTDICDIAENDTIKLNHITMLLNISLNKAVSGAKGPVHINIHIDEPLFDFTCEELPEARNIKEINSNYIDEVMAASCESVIDRFIEAKNKVIVIGQIERHDAELDFIIKNLQGKYIVVNEPLSSAYSSPFDKAMQKIKDAFGNSPKFDFVISLGGTLVSKGIKKFFRNSDICEHWEVNAGGDIHDMFMHQTGILACSEKFFLKKLLEKSENEKTNSSYELWQKQINSVSAAIDAYEPSFSQLMAIRELELSLEDMEYDYEVHYANSMTVRLGCLYSQHYIWCNRGINGIDGSISTAAGFSLATDSMVFCVTGDLSFFYDQNALWNDMLRGNFRVMIINNGGGFIFRQLKGFDNKDKSMPYVAGHHAVNARGICEQNDIGYLSARNAEEFYIAVVHFLTETTNRPIVFEVFTNETDDERTIQELNNLI